MRVRRILLPESVTAECRSGRKSRSLHAARAAASHSLSRSFAGVPLSSERQRLRPSGQTKAWRRHGFRLLLAILVLLPLPLPALDVPQLSGRINDYAHMLSPGTAQQLEQKLAAFERDQSTQIAVLTVPSLQGDDIDQFSIHVAEQWKLGQKGKDNGVLLILAQAEHKVRIEVGMGLQGVLPDITTSHIIRDVMRPYLKTGNFDQGVTAGIDAIISATKGEFKALPQGAGKTASQKTSSSFPVLLLLIAVVVVLLGAFSRYLSGLAGAIGLPLAAFLAFPGMGITMLLILAGAGLVGGFLLSLLFSGMFGGGGRGGFYGGGWGGGGFYGGGGGSSGGDDGFSGGGGGFDGGGSSDDY
ncbi:MAG: TPM domain-containing protein [Oryzomonas sp.]|uniref:TPM domain-containing protein n=1 Tax=Oryzomonas sp. TaxID=2855186 RepID=UPI00284EC013|nr:TPM domain-containing protein [Oryzomonas sp.]MDR3579843.1 TPM domain-containing protein [Oryzomonas sp.]